MTTKTTDRHQITIRLGVTPAFTVWSTDRIVPWLKLASEWPNYSPEVQEVLRPLVVKAVLDLFQQFSDSFDYCQLGLWYEEDFCQGGMNQLTQQIGGTWRPRASWPYLAVLVAIGLSEFEIGILTGPIFERNAMDAYGG